MTDYAEALSVREARARYFASNGFGDGGYGAKWVKLAPIAWLVRVVC
jgi:hypothetical protein